MEKLFCILGKSGVGKDAIVSIVSEEVDTPTALSFTTRPMRENEKQGREYNFITKEEFEHKKEIGLIAECTEYNVAVADDDVWYYGLTTEELEKSRFVIAIVNTHGLKQLTEMYGDKVVSIQISCDDLIRLKRSINRDSKANAKELCRRFLADVDAFCDIKTDYIIYNEDGMKSDSILKLKKIIMEEIEI